MSARDVSGYIGEPHIWISIANVDVPFYPNLDDNPDRKAHLKLAFADTDGGPKGLSVEQAREILKFVQDNADDETAVMVNCMAGMSRSPAVAAALVKLSGHSDLAYFKGQTPNMHVYRTILDEGCRLLGVE
jgi:protein-tyrosine phosphatase